MTYEVEKNVKEWGDKVSADTKAKIDASIERARKALRGDDMAEIRAAQEELTKVFSEAGQAFYQQQGAQEQPEAGQPAGATPGAEGGAKPADDVVEADYEIVDDKK
jgi:molecular chaperone DnaK